MQLSTAAKIPVSIEGSEPVEIDPYEAVCAIAEFRKGADWLTQLRTWLAERLGADPAQLATNQVLEFNDLAVRLVKELDEARKKKVSETVSSHGFIQDCPAAGPSGPTT